MARLAATRPLMSSYNYKLAKLVSMHEVAQSFSYWTIVMTLPVEFSTGEFRAKQV